VKSPCAKFCRNHDSGTIDGARGAHPFTGGSSTPSLASAARDGLLRVPFMAFKHCR
jgi:hypothetical protein